MFNTKFLKKLTILYVEDEDLARQKLAKSLEKLFKKVILAENGLEGLIQFQKAAMRKEHIDLVLSDINMPKMNGIEMLENIRKSNSDVPFIYTTARSESEHLLKAIELNVNHYILKPIDTQDLINRIQVVCEKKYFEHKLQVKQKELEKYLEAINHVAIVFKMTEEGEITFANKSLVEISKHSKEELLTLNFDELIHPSIPKKYLEETWDHIKEDKTWTGNTKFVDKNEETFYINNTIFKIDNEAKDEFITIGFITTKENIEKREFHKKVILNIQEFHKKEAAYKKLILELNHKVKENTIDLPLLQKELEDEKNKALSKERQINHYELQMHNIDEKYQVVLNTKAKEIDEHIKSIQSLKQKKEVLLNKNKHLEEEVIAIKDEMIKLTEINERKTKKIKDLNDIIEDMEEKASK